jgi:hypothetical protein
MINFNSGIKMSNLPAIIYLQGKVYTERVDNEIILKDIEEEIEKVKRRNIWLTNNLSHERRLGILQNVGK